MLVPVEGPILYGVSCMRVELPSEIGAVFAAHAKPSAKRTALLGYDDARQAFVFSVAAAPDGGKANAELLSYLRKEHGLVCTIISGQGARKKLVRIESRK